MKVDLSCPIELWEYALPSEESKVISFTFFNLGERMISSIQITITCYDHADEVISRRVERPMALEAAGREPFTVELAPEEQPIESVNLSIDKVWFMEGQEWRRQQDVRLVDYEPNELPPNRTLEQLRFIAGEDAVGFPSDQGNVWICVCGRVNGAREGTCRRCAREKAVVFEQYAQEAIDKAIGEREHELEEKARLAREEASRREFMRQDRTRRKKRTRRTRTLIISITLVVFVLAYLFIVLGLPELKYQTGLSALAAGEYDKARTSFVELEDYRDAQTMVSECDLREAEDYIGGSDIAKVDTAIALLEALGDYPGASEKRTEAAYRKGVLYMDAGEYGSASAQFTSVLAYEDAEALRDKSEYELAKLEMEAQDYETAATRFAALGPYIDAAALAKECVYRPASAALNEGDYDRAAELFTSIEGYKDANEQAMQSIYQAALKAQLAGDYEYAAERFEMLGNYEDAPEQVKQSVYMAAGTARDAGNYETAQKLFATIPDYLDAAEQAQACVYEPAIALMGEEDYESAAALLQQIPGYLDADDLYIQCIYRPALKAIEAEAYDEAIALLARIPDYGDAKKQRQIAEYKRAEKLEADGDLEGAIAAFTALDDYDDAQTRVKAAQYALADVAYEAGNYTLAAEQFTALGRYSNAATRAKECEYALGEALFEASDYQAAYDALSAIRDYTPAKEKAREAAYRLGELLTADGDLEGAAEAFDRAGRYEDAAERRQDSIYQWASDQKDAGEYQQAADLFNTILGYTDARAMRDECYDLWLSAARDEASALEAAGDLQGVIDLLEDMDMSELPKAYADLETMYLDANLKIARELINEERALEAYSYLITAKGYRNADELLQKNIYRILGTWETSDGVRYAFYLNGSADIAGEQKYFNMFSPYGISIGDSNDPDSMERMFSYSNGTEKTLQLREDTTDRIIRLTLVNGPELSRTNDSQGAAVVPELEDDPLDNPVVDEMVLGGDADAIAASADVEKDADEAP